MGKSKKPAQGQSTTGGQGVQNQNSSGPELFSGQGNAFNLEMMYSSQIGREVKLDFATFWVVPDGTNQCLAYATGEQITETEFAKVESTWKAIKGGTSSIEITEQDESGGAHAGFKDKVIEYLGKLMSGENGRKLVMDLAGGSKKVTIQPSAGKLEGGGKASTTLPALQKSDGTAGGGANTTITLDPDLKDDSVVVYDKDGNEISDPGFIILGHEMIHAKHNADGQNQTKKVNGSWDTSDEEDETISEGKLGISENDLRDDHGLTHRKGHAGKDTRK